MHACLYTVVVISLYSNGLTSPTHLFFQIFVGIYLCVILTLIIMCGLLFFAAAETYYQKVAVVIAFGLLSAAATIYAIWCWPKFKATLLNC